MIHVHVPVHAIVSVVAGILVLALVLVLVSVLVLATVIVICEYWRRLGGLGLISSAPRTWATPPIGPFCPASPCLRLAKVLKVWRLSVWGLGLVEPRCRD